jgi:hypothetical protein
MLARLAGHGERTGMGQARSGAGIARALGQAVDHPRLAIGLLALGLAVRMVWALLVPVNPVSDSVVYHQFAVRLADGLGYTWLDGSPSAFWPVGTSAIYGLLYAIFGSDTRVIVAFNLLLFVPILLISMRLAERWFGTGPAAVTGLLLAIWPLHIQFTTVLASELIFTALVLAILWTWDADRLGAVVRGLLLGVLLATASYVRPTAMLLGPVLLLGAAWRGDARGRIAAVMLSVVVAALLIAPWSVRNTQAFGRFTLLSTNGGVTLWMGNNPASDGGYADIPRRFAHLDEATRDAQLGAIAKAYIVAEPGRFAIHSLRRVWDTFGRETIGVAWNEPGIVRSLGGRALMPLKLVSQGFWLVVLGFGVAGLVLFARADGPLRAAAHPAAATWLYFAAIHAVIISQDRYHFAVTPLIAAFAGLAFRAALRPAEAAPRYAATARLGKCVDCHQSR